MSPRLLIADSNLRSRNVYARFFKSCGYIVDTAADGLECIERATDCEPDVLLVEADLPWGGVDGVLTCLADQHDATVPKAVVIGDEVSGTMDRLAYHQSVVRCIPRPRRLRDLVRCLHWVRAAGPYERVTPVWNVVSRLCDVSRDIA